MDLLCPDFQRILDPLDTYGPLGSGFQGDDLGHPFTLGRVRPIRGRDNHDLQELRQASAHGFLEADD
jgi:hypothetical protein